MLFDYDSSSLSDAGEDTLDALLPAYFDVVLSAEEMIDQMLDVLAQYE